MLQDVPFLAINSEDIEWDANVTLFRLPTGEHMTSHCVVVVEGEQHVAGKVL